MARESKAGFAGDARFAGAMTDLRTFTPARVSLGAAGDSLPTAPLLALRLAHSRARDAVRLPFDADTLRRDMAAKSWPSILVQSAVAGRDEYLRRPDLGRCLAESDIESFSHCTRSPKMLFAISDGLSAPAVERHAVPLLEDIFAMLPHAPAEDCPIVVIKHGRVGISDALGDRLNPDVIALLIGERPGLSSPDSLGVYLTWRPHTGRTDAERNCVSNVHDAGLSYESAAKKVVFLIREMSRRELSGLSLKDTSSTSQNLLR